MAKELNFTNRNVEAAEVPATGRNYFKDTKVQGLYLRVTSNGVRSFSFVGRAKHSDKVERLTFGRYPIVKPEEARLRATEVASRLAAGVSVAEALREKRGEMTLDELQKEFEDHRGKGKTVKKPREEALWRLYIQPKFGRRRLSDITAVDVESWHRAIPKAVVKASQERSAEAALRRAARRKEIDAAQAIRRRGPARKATQESDDKAVESRVDGLRTANLALAELRAMFNWAMNPKRGFFKGHFNPAAGQDAFKNVERERFLEADEMERFFGALAECPSETMRDFFLIALLTGARRANVASMMWAEVNLDRAEWRVAGEKMKNGDPLTIPLGDEAVLILKARKPAAGGSAFVFPSDRSKSGHIVDPKRAWTQVLAAAAIDDLRIHDLRRTLGSWQAITGASLLMISKSLGHKSLASAAIYARLSKDPVRQSMRTATAAIFEAGNIKPVGKVVPLNSASGTQQDAASPRKKALGG